MTAIGNVYSDEILHRARLSPVALAQTLGDAELAPLFEAAQSVLREWIEPLRLQTSGAFPEGDGGRLLTDRARSRLHKTDWSRTLEELEALRSR